MIPESGSRLSDKIMQTKTSGVQPIQIEWIRL